MQYLYDGSFEGFLSAVTCLMRDKGNLSSFKNTMWEIVLEYDEPSLMESVKISVIPGIIDEFGAYLKKHFGSEILRTVYHAFLSCEKGIENSIVLYILLARKVKKDPSNMLYEKCVKRVTGACRKTRIELHRYQGLLRFQKIKNPVRSDLFKENSFEISRIMNPDIYVGAFEPESDILDLLSQHFARRLKNQFFMIIDKKRDKCAVYVPGNEIKIVDFDKKMQSRLAFEPDFEDLWREYFKKISVHERKNSGLQKSNLPLKYRKHVTEFQERK